MGLESFTSGTIDALDVNNPAGTDPKSQGDNHLRGVKTVLTETFRKSDGATPWDTKLTVDEADLNNGYTPIGGAIFWTGAISAIPANWALMNGIANSSGSGINLTDKFVIFADSDGGGTNDVGDTGGSHTSSSEGAHDHTASTGSTALSVSQIPDHDHTNIGGSLATPGGAGSRSGQGQGINAELTPATGHTHSISSDGSHTHTVTNPYYAIAFIERIS